MYKTKKIFTTIVCLFLVFACGIYDDLKVLIEETEVFQTSLHEEHGLSPTVSTKLNNGRLFVFVTLDVDKLGEMTMKEVRDILHEEAEEAFSKEVHKLTINAS